MTYKKIATWLIFFLLLSSCDFKNKVTNNIDNNQNSNSYSSPLNIINKKDTLKIIVQRSDCGEWGGNKEYIYLMRNENDKIIARFIMDTISCDKIIEKDGFGVLDDRLRIVIADTTKLINLDEEKLISKMLQRLLELYLKEEVHANGGSYFEIINTNGSLNFSYWNSGDILDTYFWETRRKIFGNVENHSKK